jgi:SAM-dependent methyltransferase
MRPWQEFFKREAQRYLEYGFTKNTVSEVDFLEEELRLEAGARVLDVGCGVGRHSVELAHRGYTVVGIDLSGDMLDLAGRAAEAAGVSHRTRFVEGDAASTRVHETFNAAICLCEGAFSLLEAGADSDRHHEGILSNIHAMLDGRLVLNALSALRMIRHHTDEDVAAGRFDPYTTIETTIHTRDDGTTFATSEKGFMPAELTDLLERSGFVVEQLWGGTAGAWNRDQVRLDDIELMAVCSTVDYPR